MDRPPLREPRRFGAECISIIVGTDDNVETFTVHEALLKERGGFFEAALNKQWKEGRERKIELPEDEPDTVAKYIEWLYTKTVSPHTQKNLKDWDMWDAHKQYEYLAKLYIFGEKVQDTEFRNRCMDEFIGTTNQEFIDSDNEACFYYPGNLTIKMIFQKTHQGSPIQSACVDIYWHNAAENWFEAGWKGEGDVTHLLECPEFLLGLVRKSAGQRRAEMTKDVVLDPEVYYR